MDKDFLTTIKFGTDGWRGKIGYDFNHNNLIRAAAASCQELYYQYFKEVKNKKILIGYDRRFMAGEFAKSIIPVVKGCGLEPVLSSTYVTTPACSLYAKDFNYLGALIITASHNPFNWLGLKIKSFQGCSVDQEFTKEVQNRIALSNNVEEIISPYKIVDVQSYHLEKIRSKFNIKFIVSCLKKMNLRIFVDAMHGSAAKSIEKIFNCKSSQFIQAIRENHDPYFGGNPPEPLMDYLDQLRARLHQNSSDKIKTIGIIFDGDGDRIAVIDEQGRYCSSQVLLPYLINYLGRKNKNLYPVLKTVSGSDLIKKISENQQRNVIELPVGFKHIAKEMLSQNVLLGGEESGGIGFGAFMPERDALFSAMTLLNAIAEDSDYLANSLDKIQEEFGPSFYDRDDISLERILDRDFAEDFIVKNLPEEINGYKISNVSKLDGIKVRMKDNYWILFRFSGTEPLLRLYCESFSKDALKTTINWGRNFIEKIVLSES